MASIRAKANKKGKGVIGEGDDPESHELCPFANLPSSIITDHIMLRLPIKTLIICRFVCKTWNTLLSDSYFARLHFQCAPPGVMVATSRIMYLLELEIFESMLWINDYHRERFARNRNNCVNLGSAFKLPLPNVKYTKSQRHHPISYMRGNDQYGVVNSCNGLLCLSSQCTRDLAICNPIIGEFIKIPKSIETKSTLRLVSVGFGFQPKTNEYKVVRIWKVRQTHEKLFIVQIHTLGKPGWRNVSVDNEFLTKINKIAYPTCVNGALHWSYYDGWKMSILCFDFESERFQPFPSPPQDMTYINRFSLAELGGFLYASDASSRHSCIMWVMKSYGVEESWTKVFSIDNLGDCFWPYGECWPVKHVEKGVAILMETQNCLVYYEPEKNGYKLLWVIESKLFKIEVIPHIIPHIPSFVSLKDVVNGDNIEVLNVNSRCFKSEEKDEVLFLTASSSHAKEYCNRS